RETIEKANQANEGFEASTFVKRLEKAAGEQRAITSAFKEGFTKKPYAQLLGVTGEQLSATDRLLLDDKVRKQTQTTSDVRWIQEDLMHFHARTQQPIHKQVVDEMAKADIATQLELIREKLGPDRVLTYTAAEKAQQNAELLEAWAKLLKGDDENGNSGSSGSGDGQGDKEKEDFEFMLRVMKMIQTQQDLRARTRALEQLRRSAETSIPRQP
ncbi:MAG TPA: hypothetical protein VFY13_07275, partial [Luteolibacter sp.]|nr:hypothetical protein [Luteolibacter sp.]